MQVLTNHLGYASKDPKKAVFVAEEGVRAGAFRVMRAADGEAVFTGETQPHGAVARWNKGNHWTMDFDSVRGEGRYFVEVHTDRGPVRSQVFEIREKLLSMRLINAVGYSFKAQRSSGEWMERDRAIPFSGPREGEVDVHGGWYDATGDYGIHLSHLSHSTYHNPQQASFTALMFFRLADLLEASGNEQLSQVKRRMMDEAYFGADFLMRMQAPSGSFFRSIGRGDALGRPGEQRTVGFEYHGSSAQFGAAATAGSETVNDENYEVSLRAGGGMAIAALAAAGRYYYPSMEYCQADYIAVAQTAWAYLSKNNERYTNDGRWNLIDEFCALEALVELYRTTREYDYLRQARTMAGKVLARLKEHNGAAYLEMDEGKPFHHAADEGLPVVALLDYRAIETDCQLAAQAQAGAERLMQGTLTRSHAVANPYGYPRLIFRNNDGSGIKEQFFFPHNSNAAPWWQGDNARIASLATAALQVAAVTADEALGDGLRRFAADQINWILGLNPFDACMMEGYGRNNIQYFFNLRYDFLNCPGAICNGITSGLDDEEGIEFVLEPTERIVDNWRWAEQWIPHGTWFLYAVASSIATQP